MVIDRIIAGTIFVLGIVQITLMYAAPDMAPLSMTAPTLVLVSIMVVAYIIEATTIFFRRTRPISMLWICLIAEAVTMGTAIMQGLHNSHTIPQLCGDPLRPQTSAAPYSANQRLHPNADPGVDLL